MINLGIKVLVPIEILLNGTVHTYADHLHMCVCSAEFSILPAMAVKCQLEESVDGVSIGECVLSVERVSSMCCVWGV